MKFLCGNCKAKYQIADEKVTGRTLRMKCRRCGHDILIDGHAMQSSVPPPPAARRTSVAPGPVRATAGMQAPNLPRPATAPRPQPPPAPLSADFRRHVAAPPEVPQRTAPYDLWHVAIQDVPVGPMTRDELARKVESGAVTSESLCWREGMDDWRPFGELPELAALARRAREARGTRTRPHSVPPAAARQLASVPSLADDDDEGAEPTRISEFMPSIGQAMPPLAPASAAQKPPLAPAPTQAVAQPAPTRAPSSDRMVIGLLAGIVLMGALMGGPMLFRMAWGTTPQQKPAAEPVAAVEKPAPPPRAQVPPPSEEPDEPDEEVKVTARPAGPRAPRPGVKPEGDKPKQLSDEQRRLLERMGGGGNDPDLRAVASRSVESGGAGGAIPAALTPQQLTKVVQDNKTQLQRCYETALRAAGGKQEGAVKITVSVVVGTSGTTKSVNTQGDGLGNMTECIRGAVKRWRFPQAGGDSEFAFPLVFQPGA